MSDRLNDFLVFLRIIEAGGFNAAARTLGMTPSAVSKVVTRLEARLVTRLFVRNARSLALTGEGRAFAEAIRPAIERLEEAEAALRSEGALEGRLRLHALPTFALHQLPPLLAECRRRHPGLSVDLVLGNDPIDLVEQGIDISIQSGQLPASSWKRRRLAGSRWIVCAAPAYLAAREGPATPAELARHPCLTFALRTAWNHWPLKGLKGPMQGAITANNGEMLAELARAGQGIACLAAYHIQKDLAAGRLCEILAAHHSGEEEEIVALFAPERHVPPRVRAFLDLAAAHFATPPWQEAD